MKQTYNGRAVPTDGKAIDYVGGKFVIPDRPIIPFIEGDGTGRDIWKASRRVFDAAVEQAYGGERRVAWCEDFAGEKALYTFKQGLSACTVCGFTACSRSVFLRAPSALLCGRSQPRAAAGKNGYCYFS